MHIHTWVVFADSLSAQGTHVNFMIEEFYFSSILTTYVSPAQIFCGFCSHGCTWLRIFTDTLL